MHITKQQFMDLYGRMLGGAMANPANGHTIWDSYQRQQLMQGLYADLEITLSTAGIRVETDSDDITIKFVGKEEKE